MTHDDTLIYCGDAVKALGSGKVGGYLVRFGVVDVQGDLFDAATDFGVEDGQALPVYYHHGVGRRGDPHADRLSNRRFGRGAVKTLDDGLWIEATLDLDRPGVPEVYADVEAGRMGWSSGSSDRFVRFAPLDVKGQPGRRITQWHLNDASLTPTPVERRNRALPLKALIDEAAAAPSLLEDLCRLATDAERLRGLSERAVKARTSEGRSLSSAKLDAIKSAGDGLLSLYREATAPVVDLADIDADLDFIGAYLSRFQ